MSSPTSATLVYEVQSGGIASDNNGGGFDPGVGGAGTDYTQGAGQQVISWLASGGTYGAMLTSTGSPWNIIGAAGARGFLSGDGGNVINLTGGGFTAGRYIIESVSSGFATLDRACASGNVSAGTGYLGGPLASPGMLGSVLTTAGQTGWIKQATYTLTTASSNVSGGQGFAAANTRTEGYKTTRGDRAGRPTISAGSVTFGSLTPLYGTAASGGNVAHVKCDANNVNNACGFSGSQFVDCEADNCTGTGGVYGFSITGMAINCKGNNCVIGFYSSSNYDLVGCWALACGTGFSLTGTRTVIVDCIASGSLTTIGSNSGLSGDGFASTGSGCLFVNCTSDSNAGHGFDVTGATTAAVNCLATNHTTAAKYGFYGGTAYYLRLDTCAVYGNTGAGNYNANVAAISPPGGPTVLTAAPYVSAGSDFRPNATAGGGAALKGVGLGVSQQGEGTGVGSLDYRAIGACQDTPLASTDPGVGNVLSGTGYTINGSSLSGTLTLPAVADVLASYGAWGAGGSGSTGTLTLPGVGNVLASAGNWGVGGNGSTGTLTLPAAADVLASYGSWGVGGSGSTGTLTLPAAGKVASGTAYGVGGNGSTGTRTDCPAADALTIISYGDPGAQITGTVNLPADEAGAAAAQLAADTAAVTAAKASIASTVTLLGVAGTLNMSLYVLIANVVQPADVIYGIPCYTGGPTGTYGDQNGLIQDQITALLAGYGIVTPPAVEMTPVAPNGDLSLVAGVDYCTALGNLLSFDASGWPSLATATGVTLTLHPIAGGAADLGPVTGSVLNPGGPNQAVQFGLNHTQTAAIAAGVGAAGRYTHTYTLEAAWTGGTQWAPPRGNASVYAM